MIWMELIKGGLETIALAGVGSGIDFIASTTLGYILPVFENILCELLYNSVGTRVGPIILDESAFLIKMLSNELEYTKSGFVIILFDDVFFDRDEWIELFLMKHNFMLNDSINYNLINHDVVDYDLTNYDIINYDSINYYLMKYDLNDFNFDFNNFNYDNIGNCFNKKLNFLNASSDSDDSFTTVMNDDVQRFEFMNSINNSVTFVDEDGTETNIIPFNPGSTILNEINECFDFSSTTAAKPIVTSTATQTNLSGYSYLDSFMDSQVPLFILTIISAIVVLI